MSSIKTTNVHRSNLLQKHLYGIQFQYDERVAVGPAVGGRERAKDAILATSRKGDDLPKQGKGPSKEEREAGSYDFWLIGITDGGQRVDVTIYGDRDPRRRVNVEDRERNRNLSRKNRVHRYRVAFAHPAQRSESLAKWLMEHAGLCFRAE